MSLNLEFGELTRECDDALYNSDYEAENLEEDYLNTAPWKKFSEGLKEELRKNGYTGDVDSVEEMVAFVKRKCSENGVKLNKANVQKWLNDQQRPQKRKLVFQFCFALGLSLEETKAFFEKSFLERAFNFRDPEDCVYYFCIRKGLKSTEAERLIAEAKAVLEDSSEKVSAFKNTIEIGNSLEALDTEEELLDYFRENSAEFAEQNMTARKQVKRLLEDATKIANGTTDKKNVNINLILSQLNADTRSSEMTGKHSFSRAAKFPDTFKDNFPMRQMLANIKDGKKVSNDSMRKALILLKFYEFYGKKEDEKADDKYEEFEFELNDLLEICGHPELYPRNPYDWVFMHCARCEDPLKEFSALFDRYYKDLVLDVQEDEE